MSKQKQRNSGSSNVFSVGGRPLKALDIFAMPEPPSAEGERLWRAAMGQVARDRKDRRLNRLRTIKL